MLSRDSVERKYSTDPDKENWGHIWQGFLLKEDYLLMFDKMIIVTSASRS